MSTPYDDLPDFNVLLDGLGVSLSPLTVQTDTLCFIIRRLLTQCGKAEEKADKYYKMSQTAMKDYTDTLARLHAWEDKCRDDAERGGKRPQSS